MGKPPVLVGGGEMRVSNEGAVSNGGVNRICKTLIGFRRAQIGSRWRK